MVNSFLWDVVHFLNFYSCLQFKVSSMKSLIIFVPLHHALMIPPKFDGKSVLPNCHSFWRLWYRFSLFTSVRLHITLLISSKWTIPRHTINLIKLFTLCEKINQFHSQWFGIRFSLHRKGGPWNTCLRLNCHIRHSANFTVEKNIKCLFKNQSRKHEFSFIRKQHVTREGASECINFP